MTEFEAIVEQKLPLYRRMAFRCLGNIEDAEDAVQDALLLAHNNLARFRGEAALGTWVGSIVINCALMFRRRNKKFYTDAVLEELTVKDSAPSAEHLVDQSLKLDRMMRASLRLSPVLYNTFLLRASGKSVKEIATLLAAPEGTIKAQLARVRRKLKDEIYD